MRFALLLTVVIPASAVPPLNADSDRVAIGGNDPVAFFTDSDAASGNRRLGHQWGGGAWWFASAEHRDRFAAEYATR